jgi:hypothetical protein
VQQQELQQQVQLEQQQELQQVLLLLFYRKRPKRLLTLQRVRVTSSFVVSSKKITAITGNCCWINQGIAPSYIPAFIISISGLVVKN